MADLKLLFKDPRFEADSIQVTVRDGLKWDAIVTHLPFAVDVCETGREDETLGEAVIVGKMVVDALAIPNEILSLEHSPSCRNYNGLCEAMCAAYGESWRPDNTVTVLFFRYNPAGGW